MRHAHPEDFLMRPRGAVDSWSRWKKNVRPVTPLQGYLLWVFGLIHEEMHVWCGLGVQWLYLCHLYCLRYENDVIICIWDVRKYQHCMKSIRKYMWYIFLHIYTVFDEINTCNKVYMNLIHLILTGDLWPPLTIHPLIRGLAKKCPKTLHLKIWF